MCIRDSSGTSCAPGGHSSAADWAFCPERSAGTKTGTAHAYTRVASALRLRVQLGPEPRAAPDPRRW
eukprot:1562429-Alexandrium_andersonii.AAC.1